MNQYENDQTLAAYNQNVRNYRAVTPAIHTSDMDLLLNWMDESVSYIPDDGTILEIGSATARDATYLRTLGYEVICSDGAEGFVRDLRAEGEPALLLNAILDDLGGPYDMVFANAVAPHFTPEALGMVLANVAQSLKTGGVFAFNVK